MISVTAGLRSSPLSGEQYFKTDNLDIISIGYIKLRSFYDSIYSPKRTAAPLEPVPNPFKLKPLVFHGMIIAQLMRVKPVRARLEVAGIINKKVNK